MKYLSVLLLGLLALTSCMDDDDALVITDCGPAIGNVREYAGLSGDHFDLLEFSTEGTCLTVTIGASGCSAEGWSMELFTDGRVAESLPTQTSARLVFDDGVDGGASCLAYFNESYTFDLSSYLNGGALPTNLALGTSDSTSVTLFIE